ncbi:MAG TPA: HAD family hydrolase [Candidatus Limnocylindrales bacterium]|nr:HAD family hydrolase [Candidatus Limnocylindrales bacterium]
MTIALHPILDGIDLVVFDKDGTLIAFEAMWSGWARELGTRLEIVTRRPVAGDVFTTIGFDPVSGRILAGGPLAIATMGQIQELVGAVLRRWCPSVNAARRVLADAWFEPDPVRSALPLADLDEVFTALRGAGRRIAIATTDDRRPTEATLAGLGLTGFVDVVLCGDDHGPTKPEPAALAAIAAGLGIGIQRTAMVGDTPADLRMARGAGARPIGVASGITSAAELAPDADLVVDSIAMLVRSTRP